MNKTLTDYLSSVLRNDLSHESISGLRSEKQQVGDSLVDVNKNHFLVDARYSLRLDEVV
jgi:hypothetical protein